MNTTTNHSTFGTKLAKTAFGLMTVLTLAFAPHSMAHAGTFEGPKSDSGTIPGREIYVYRMDFNAGEKAEVAALGDGDLDIKVYDENGNLITKDTASDGAPEVSWTPEWTGRFTIKVINNEYHTVHFAMHTN